MAEVEKLPYRVLMQSAQIFRGVTGFSCEEMADSFRYQLDQRSNELAPEGFSSRRETFECWLAQFPVWKKRRLPLQLCCHDHKMYCGQPTDKERAGLAVKSAASMASFLLATYKAKGSNPAR